MKLLLLLTDRCATCVQTEQVWKQACNEHKHELTILSTQSALGRSLVENLDLHTFPALIAGARVCAVGLPSLCAARDILWRLHPGDGQAARKTGS